MTVDQSGSTATSSQEPRLDGQYVACVGKLGGLNRKEFQTLVREQGGIPVDVNHPNIDLVIVGAEELPLEADGVLDDAVLARAEQEEFQILHETQLWELLGLVDQQTNIRQLYTPAMLAELLGIPKATIRRWHRQGLIMPVREVYRLPYFDFQEVITARRLAQLLAAGATPTSIASKLRRLSQLVPDVERPLAQLAVIVEGREILLRDGEGLLDLAGQRRFDFDAFGIESDDNTRGPFDGNESGTLAFERSDAYGPELSVEALLDQAAHLEAEGRFEEAIDAYRSAQLAEAPRAEIHFMLAELLYRGGDITAARERYYAALELDEDYVEARANLGCILVETGQPELAIAAFEGALSRHPEYPDVLFHLARTLDELGRSAEAIAYWQRFLDQSADSPWAAEAKDRLGISTEDDPCRS